MTITKNKYKQVPFVRKTKKGYKVVKQNRTVAVLLCSLVALPVVAIVYIAKGRR